MYIYRALLIEYRAHLTDYRALVEGIPCFMQKQEGQLIYDTHEEKAQTKGRVPNSRDEL